MVGGGGQKLTKSVLLQTAHSCLSGWLTECLVTRGGRTWAWMLTLSSTLYFLLHHPDKVPSFPNFYTSKSLCNKKLCHSLGIYHICSLEIGGVGEGLWFIGGSFQIRPTVSEGRGPSHSSPALSPSCSLHCV